MARTVVTPEAVFLANRRIALLIATDSYGDPEFTSLRTPCTDAQALAALLGNPGIGAFEVTTLLNRPAQNVREALDETFTDTSRDDLVLLHVSGHGLKDESGKLHLIMSDTRRRALRSSAVAASWVRELIDHSAARRVVVWLDCCFSGAFPPGFTPKGNETVDAIDQLAGDSGRGCAVMTASTKVQYAFEKEQSIFTEAIMSGLRTGGADLNEDGLIDASELYSYVHDWVRARTPGQTPTRNDMLAGDIHIAHNPNVLRLPPELAPELRYLLRSSDPKFRSLGIRELFALVEAGNETARIALTAIGEEPTEVSPLPPDVVEVARPLSDQLRRTAPTGFYFTHEINVFQKNDRETELSCVAFDPLRPKQLCAAVGHDLWWLDARTGAAAKVPADGRAIITTGTVDAVAFSTDGTLMAVGGVSGIVLFDRRSRQNIPGPAAENSELTCGLAFSPDSSLLASVGDDHIVRLWRPHRRKVVWELDYQALSIAFSSDGRMLAVGGPDSTVLLWDVSSGEHVQTLSASTSAVSMAFGPVGQVLVTGGDDGVVRSGFPSESWRPGALNLRHEGEVVSVAFDAKGVLASASKDGRVLFRKPT